MLPDIGKTISCTGAASTRRGRRIAGLRRRPGVVAYAWLGDSGERDDFWESVKLAVDHGQPVAVCGGGDCVVVCGYSEGLVSRRL
jgi:hypothetical protein